MHDEYEFMTRVVNEFVKGHGIKIVLTAKVFKGFLHVYYYNWVGTDDCYYSLLAPCSKTMIYEYPNFATTTGGTMTGVLKKNLRCFENKDEWNKEKWKPEEAEECAKRIADCMGEYSALIGTFGEYSVLGVEVHLQPALGVTVWYKKECVGCVTCWYGSVATVVTEDSGMVEFIERIGLERLVKVVCLRPENLNRIARIDVL